MDPGKGLGQGPSADRRVRAGNQVQNDLAVRGGLKNGALRLQLRPETTRIDQITVMGDGDLSATALHRDGLGVLDRAGTGRRVAHMPDRPRACEILEVLLPKHLPHQPHAPPDPEG